MKLYNIASKMHSVTKYLTNSTRAGIPLEVFLILTNECNYRCQVCSLWKGLYKDSDEKQMTLSEIKSLIDDGASLGVPTFLISGGEPLLHPNFLDVAEYTVKKINNVRVNTNASLITREIAGELVAMGLHELWVSLDGMGEYYNKFRGVRDAYSRTVAGIRMINEEKKKRKSKKPRILVDTIVSKDNASMLPDFIGVLHGLEVDEANFVHICYVSPESVKETEKILGRDHIYSGQFTTSAGANAVGARLSHKQVSEIHRSASKGPSIYIDPLLLAHEGDMRSPCRCIFPWTNLMVFSGGDACVCVLLDFITIGNVKRQNIMEIWNGEIMQEMRRKAKNGYPVCKYCICTRRVPLDHLKHRQTLRRILR